MDNLAVARALTDLADLHELGGTLPFKVRAFRTAARAIEGYGGSIADLVEKDALAEVRGVGDGVARRIKELFETGRITEAEELRAKLPPGLLDLMNLPGIGLKTAQQVWKERGVTSVDELEAAAKEGRLRDLPRFGEKKEEKLVASIAAWRKRAAAPKRRPLAEAMRAAEGIVLRMKTVGGVLACEYAGSLRRRAETVGDLDILVAAEASSAAAIMDAFVDMPGVAEVLGKGDTKSSVQLAESAGGMQADLRVVPPASWGAALQYFTGSKDHNVAMRTIAVKKRLKVSEYGVFDESGKSVAGADEAGVYEAIGLAWMPPEMRENRGEVELAGKRALPSLVTLDDVQGDLHMHTTETDGKSTLDEMAAAAKEMGRSYIAITDHSETLTFVRGMSAERLRAQKRKIREVEERQGIRLFAGIEADILADGRVDLEHHVAELEWVVGSVHQHLRMTKDEMTKRVVRAIESGNIDCLGHPTGRQLGLREPSELDMEAVIAACARAGVAIELNATPLRLDANEHTAKMAREAGVPVVLNSDAHSVHELEHLRYGIGIARRAWLGKEHVLNTRAAEGLAEWRKQRLSA
ncbi:MAG: DNA polymerase/3'-5' exonuclease PolX [Labilithrix sp.]|nr:DNA polymerase/3'-5' exonuclease PolX [Labilithrix sp.]MCW5813426.1 DNA polymerase/3'-5' exonuclease PolX [Labilithrix sp.]